MHPCPRWQRPDVFCIPFPSWGLWAHSQGRSFFWNRRPHTWKGLSLMGIWDNKFPPRDTWFTCRPASVVFPSILPSVSIWVQSMRCECQTARLCFTSQLLPSCLHLSRFLQGWRDRHSPQPWSRKEMLGLSNLTITCRISTYSQEYANKKWPKCILTLSFHTAFI